MPTQGNRPSLATEAAHENYLAAGLTADSTVLDDLSGRFMAGYLSGVLAGIDLGREQMEAEQDELHRRAVAVVHAMAKLPTFEELKESRHRHKEEAGAKNRRPGQPWPLEVAS